MTLLDTWFLLQEEKNSFSTPLWIGESGAEDPPHPPPRGLGLSATEWTPKAHPGTEARARPNAWARTKSHVRAETRTGTKGP